MIYPAKNLSYATKEDRRKTYHGITETLSTKNVNPKDKADQEDAHFFLGVVSDLEAEDVDMAGGYTGTEEALARMFTAFLESENATPKIKKAIFLAAANNLIHNYGKKAEAIGFLLGNYVEEDMGGIECNCPECVARRQAVKTDHSIN